MKTEISENLLNDPAVLLRALQPTDHGTQPVTVNDHGTRTPWGPADTRTRYAEGIYFYTTIGHGGFHLSWQRLGQMTEKLGPVKTFCGDPQWFEEDCDWCYVALAFPELFSAHAVTEAGVMRQWLAERAKERGR